MCNLCRGGLQTTGALRGVCLFVNCFFYIEVSMLCWFQVYNGGSVICIYMYLFFFKFISQIQIRLLQSTEQSFLYYAVGPLPTKVHL